MATSKLNHVAMSVPAHVLTDATRREIVAFYRDVFDWSEQVLDEPGNPLVIRISSEPTQFVFVQPDAGDGTRAGYMDHFGIDVPSEAALDDILAAAYRYREKDERVDIVEKQLVRTTSPDGTSVFETINCYIGYLLPMMVEVQHFRRSVES